MSSMNPARVSRLRETNQTTEQPPSTKPPAQREVCWGNGGAGAPAQAHAPFFHREQRRKGGRKEDRGAAASGIAGDRRGRRPESPAPRKADTPPTTEAGRRRIATTLAPANSAACAPAAALPHNPTATGVPSAAGTPPLGGRGEREREVV
uniref:Uncharacterized protein n=1 Tax=Oryza rufipogon TaxID=4529 RepID=A0A0E0R767_ORYRU